jgi:hypothetical protein
MFTLPLVVITINSACLTTLSEPLSFYLSQQAIYVVRVYMDPFCQI